MTRIFTILLSLAICPLIAAAGEIQRFQLNVGEFDELYVDNNVCVEYHCNPDSAGLAVYETTRELANVIIFDSSKKDRLTIQTQFAPEEDSNVSGLPVIKVYSKFLNKVVNGGDSVVKVISPTAVPKFSAVIIGNGSMVITGLSCNDFSGAIKTGNGQIVVSGTCDKATLSNTGVGTIQADNLKAKTASCRFFGTGTTGIWVTDKLVIKGAFPGNLYYKGTPSSVKNYSIGVKVHHINDDGSFTHAQ